MEATRNDNDSHNRVIQTCVDILNLVILLIKITVEIFVAALKQFTAERMKDVSGETVLITGTGHGIGRELALQYAALGATVVCVDVNEAGNLETVKEVKTKCEGEAYGYTCDISQRESVLDLAKKIEKEIGDITILVNNAGIMPSHPIDKHMPSEIQKIIDINVMAHFWTLEAFLPGMRKKHRGHIVSIASVAGHVGLSNLVPYCASKFAVRGMMEALYEEFRQNGESTINFTCVSPFMVNTGLCKKPIVKFPRVFGLLDANHVAETIISAQRRNEKCITIPYIFSRFLSFCRLLPISCQLLIGDFIGSGVESDL